MTVTYLNEPRSAFQYSLNYCTGLLLDVGTAAIAGFCVSSIFHIINPLHGACYCGLITMVSKIVNPIFAFLFNQKGGNFATIVLSKLITILFSAAISIGVSSLLGFPISFNIALALCAIVISAYITTFFLSCIGITIYNYFF